MALQAVQGASQAGTIPTFNAVAASDTFPNTGREVIHVKNGAGAPINVTIVSQALCNQGSTHNLVVAVPAGQDRRIGPLDPARFNDASDLCTVQFSSTTTITAAYLRNS